MQSQLIPAERWIPFFETFSRDHLGWTATIEVAIGPSLVVHLRAPLH